ncbi:MAG: oxidoreductase, partial [Firmicutes bacterium]|nr:oxidoreductase [Bacillota bacterium]
MTADSISLIDRGLNENDFNRLTALLRQTSMTSSLEKDILETDAELVFADGNIIAKLKALGRDFSGVEISLPSLGYTDVIPKTHLGPAGGLLLCEQIINGMRY